MKTLYININNEQIQSNEELEVLKHDLDSDFFFYLGEKIAKGCKAENENALITDFNTQEYDEDYKQIISQWNEIKTILFSEKCEGEFKFTLPNGYIHWLRYSEKYNHVHDKNFSHGEPVLITIDLEELYEDSIEDLQRKILRKLQRDDLYLEIDEIVFNDDAVTRKSSIIRTIKDKYEGIGFKIYKKWLQENEKKPHTSPQVCEKCKKNPCECNTTPISSNDFFPYKGFYLGVSYPKEFKDWDFMRDDNIVYYKIDDCVTLMGETKRDDSFIAAMVDSTISSNNKLPKEWSNILGCRFGAFREKCRRALNEKGFEIILDEDTEIVVVSPSEKYRVYLVFDIDTSKFAAILITLNACPYCSSSNFALRKIKNEETYISYCTDCDKSYLPCEVESEELDEVEENETPSCPNCSSDDVDDDGSDYLQYTCNDCGHNWGHDDTVECPECGSDDVENDGTDNLQYGCNACGHRWGVSKYDVDNDDTDNAGNQMSEYFDVFGLIVGKSTENDVRMKGGKIDYSGGGKSYVMPNNINVGICEGVVSSISISHMSKESFPKFYENIGLHWGLNKYFVMSIFENLGFIACESRNSIIACKYCEKYDRNIYFSINYVIGNNTLYWEYFLIQIM